mmetsp:Transcript_26921/g.47909  ORF Transcript_26921/g.47909 Transcript_26921/m.47909 type:complete len:254 (+) Transcript_26921:100-861(+)
MALTQVLRVSAVLATLGALVAIATLGSLRLWEAPTATSKKTRRLQAVAEGLESSVTNSTMLLSNFSDNLISFASLGNFSENLTSSSTSLGNVSENLTAGQLKLEGAARSHAAHRGQPCLCIFDIDRTLTGKQGDTGRCPGNRVTDGWDGAYGGGKLTLSKLGQQIGSTFCGQCRLAAITAHGSQRQQVEAVLAGGPVVRGCDGQCKVERAQQLARQLGVHKGQVFLRRQSQQRRALPGQRHECAPGVLWQPGR